MSQTTEFNFDNGEYFAAHTDNGGFRIGMNGVAAIEVPASHPLYADMANLSSAQAIENFIDACVESGHIDIRVFN